MNTSFKHTLITVAVAAATAITAASSYAAGTIEDFQARVNKIAAEKGVPAPDVKKGLEAQARGRYGYRAGIKRKCCGFARAFGSLSHRADP